MMAILETLWPPQSTNKLSFTFEEPVERFIFTASDNPTEFLNLIEKHASKGLWIVGFMSYEFGYLLEKELFNLFDSPNLPVAYFVGFKKAHISQHLKLQYRNDAFYSIENIKYELSKEEYTQKINKVKEHIEKGDIYQLNFTFKLFFNYSGSPVNIYLQLRDNQPVAYSAFIQDDSFTIISLSPELFLERHRELITTRPMKGTISRGRWYEEDVKRAESLRRDEKI